MKLIDALHIPLKLTAEQARGPISEMVRPVMINVESIVSIEQRPVEEVFPPAVAAALRRSPEDDCDIIFRVLLVTLSDGRLYVLDWNLERLGKVLSKNQVCQVVRIDDPGVYADLTAGANA